MKLAAKEGTVASPGLAWPVGDFYVPGFASDGRTGLVPGAPIHIGGSSLHGPRSSNQSCL